MPLLPLKKLPNQGLIEGKSTDYNEFKEISLGKKIKRKKKQNKKNQRGIKAFSLPQWYKTGLGEWSTEDILAQLKQYGLEMDETRFRQDADNYLEPHAVAEMWPERVESVPGRGKDFFHLSALELWRRLLPERDAFGLVAEDLSAYIDQRTDYSDSPATPREVQDLMDVLDRLYALLETRSAQKKMDMKDLLDEIFDGYGLDVGYFLVCLPFDLEGDGFVDEAVSVARKFAFVEKGNMLADLGQILASSGRCAEALSQVKQNLQDMSDNSWVIIKAGDVYDQCGHADEAIKLYVQALEMAADQYTKDGATERLITIYEKMGKNEEARALQERWKKDHEEWIEDRKPYSLPMNSFQSRRIGRNEPCPCGSGLKYKKCCLNK